jgi:co-chaperonin GroES (HSP10)
MNVKPLGNKIAVERIAADKTTNSGIILQSTQEPDKATVLALGPEVNEVNVGDKVLINWNKAVKFEGENYIIPITEVIFVYE